MKPLIKFFTNEWYFAAPLVIMSLIAIALVFWRFLLNLSAKTSMAAFLPNFQEKLDQEGIESANKYCKTQRGIIPSKLYPAALESSGQGIAAMKRAMSHSIELEILPSLNYLLASILAIAKIATMVGLLLTVISMINTFTAIGEASKSGGSNVGNQSESIGLALFGTAGGLVIAIPLVFFHVLFKARVSKFEVELKSAAQRLIVLFQNLKPKP